MRPERFDGGAAAILTAALLAGCGPGSANPVAEPGSTALSTPAVGRVVAVENQPEGIAYDPRSGILAVGVRNSDQVLFLDREGNLIRRVAVSSAPRHLRFASPGGPLLVPAEKSGELDVVEVPEGQVVERDRVGRQPHDAVQADGRFFVTNEFSDSVSVIENGATIAELPAPAQPGGIAATSSDVCIVGVRSHLVEILDPASLRKLASASAGAGPTHVAADADACYVVDTAGGALLAFSTRPSFALASRTAIAGKPYGICIDALHRRLWITETATNSVAELELGGTSPELIATFPSVRQPNSVAVDPTTGRVFVTGTGDGVLQILDPPT